MASFNKVILLGNLTRDPQLSYLPSQTPVVEFGLATNRKFKGQDGNMRDDTTFHECKAFGTTAETIAKYCTKGKPLMVEGRCSQDRWEKDGQKRSKNYVTIESFTFVGGGDNTGGQQQSSPPSQPARVSGTTPPPVDEDEIPF